MTQQVLDTLHIWVTYNEYLSEEGEEKAYYVALSREIMEVTDGRTWNELMRNIHEMISASVNKKDATANYNLIPNPRIVITMELPENYTDLV